MSKGHGRSRNPELRRIRLAAAATRLVVAVALLGFAPFVAPQLPSLWILFGGYALCASVALLLIWLELGGERRVVGFALVDVALLSYLIHRLGSVESPLLALYVVFGLAHALVTRMRTALSLAAVASLAYAGILEAEALGLLPHAPDAPVPVPLPNRPFLLASGVLVAGLTLGTTALVGRLLLAIRSHERELVVANAQLEELSRRDPLTAVFNRRYVLERLDVELARLRRGHPMALLAVDLDRFKAVNDTHGHGAGDLLLERIGRVLDDVTRETDVPGRIGGDEFVLLLPDTDGERARSVAERVLTHVRALGVTMGDVTASIGIAIPEADEPAAALLRRADRALYAAKARGGDTLVHAECRPLDHDPSPTCS